MTKNKINDNEIIIVNGYQVNFYVECGLQPLRLEVGEGNKTLYVYDIEQTKEAWKKWKSHCFMNGYARKKAKEEAQKVGEDYLKQQLHQELIYNENEPKDHYIIGDLFPCEEELEEILSTNK